MPARYPWTWLRGDHYTVSMLNSSVNIDGTYHPVVLDTAVDPIVLKEAASAGQAVWGIAKNQSSGSLATMQVIVSEDIFRVRCSGDLERGMKVQIETDNAVSKLTTTGAVNCGHVVDYDPIAWTGGTPGLCIIKARFESGHEGVADTYGLLSYLDDKS